MKLIKIYFASGMKTMDTLENLAKKIYNKFKDKVVLYVPKSLDTYEHSYVWSDIERLKNSDILILHIPTPTVGASSEMALFSYLKPHNISIAYKCMDHGWIKELTKYQTNSEEVIFKIIEDHIKGLEPTFFIK